MEKMSDEKRGRLRTFIEEQCGSNALGCSVYPRDILSLLDERDALAGEVARLRERVGMAVEFIPEPGISVHEARDDDGEVMGFWLVWRGENLGEYLTRDGKWVDEENPYRTAPFSFPTADAAFAARAAHRKANP